MEKQALMEKAYARVKADYDTLEQQWLGKEPKWLIKEAYMLAHIYEAYYYLDNELMRQYPEDCHFNEEQLMDIVNFSHGNIVEAIYNEWLYGNYENEYTNFFCWSHLADIVESTLSRKEGR